MSKRQISRDDIMTLEEYERVRTDRVKAMTEMKKNRRVSVGPDMTFYFENYDTMWHQIHEMLRIEKGGEEQIEDELQAYAPLIPDGRTLVATMMIEIEDKDRRARVLGELGHVEDMISFSIGDQTVKAVPEDDAERTTEDGKTSSVHFLKFPFAPEQAAAFKGAGTRVILNVSHPQYDHMAALSEKVRAALAQDLD